MTCDWDQTFCHWAAHLAPECLDSLEMSLQPVPDASKQPQNISEPPTCFTAGAVFIFLCMLHFKNPWTESWSDLSHILQQSSVTRQCVFWPIPVSSVNRFFFPLVAKSMEVGCRPVDLKLLNDRCNCGLRIIKLLGDGFCMEFCFFKWFCRFKSNACFPYLISSILLYLLLLLLPVSSYFSEH